MSWNDLIGRQLGSYQIVEEIGRGGSSRVYRGYDQERQIPVAVKVIPNDAEDRVGFVRRFEREVRAIAQLNHPHIVRVFDRGETEELVYLVMQFVGGGTLRQRLGRALPYAEAAAAIVQMAQALHHAHQHGIIHRDVKPSNMLVDIDDTRQLLLTDFGIAKLTGMRGLTKSGTTIGTPEYMAPEQAEGKEIDQRADVYSLGCVLYESLSGRPPFIGSTPVSVLYQQVHSRPAYLRGFNPDVPRELARVVELALAKRPEDRYGTAETLAQALLPFAEGYLPEQDGLAGQSIATLPVAPASQPRPRLPNPSGTFPRYLRQAPDMGSDPLSPDAESGGESKGGESQWPILPQPGMGVEGLDALFPESGELPPRPGSAEPAAQGGEPQLPPGPPVRRPLRQTIPLPAFRLPAKQTRPLNLPLTSEGELDIEALMAQVERQEREQQRPAYEFPPPAPPLPMLDDEPAQRELGVWRRETGQSDIADRPTINEAFGAFRQDVTERDTILQPPGGRGGRGYGSSARKRRGRGARRRSVLAGVAVAAALVLALLGWVIVSATGLGVTVHPQGHATATMAAPTATATTAATATSAATKSPARATPNTQLQLNREAAAAFSGVTVATFSDNSCSNSTTQFGPGQAVYANLCGSSSANVGPVTIAVVQGGQTVLVLDSGIYIAPGSHYFKYTYGLSAGSYTMVVTVQINGRTGVARSIPFSIG